MAQVNPYNILAFYSYQPGFDEPAPLVCAPSLLSFQIRKTTITTVTEFVIIAEDGGEQDMDISRIETACTTGYGGFATYKANAAPSLPDGKYQFKVVLDDTTYYSFASSDDFAPYITTIGLYNDAGQLLAIGKLANSIRKRNDVDMNFLIRLDLDKNITFKG